MTEWPSKRRPLTKIRPSDGCKRRLGGGPVDFHEFGCHLGNVGVKLAENDRLEHRHRVPGLSPRRRLPFLGRLAPDRLQAGTEILPRNHRVDPRQRIVLGVQAGIPIRDVEKAHLAHGRFPTSTRQTVRIITDQGSEQGFLEVPISHLDHGPPRVWQNHDAGSDCARSVRGETSRSCLLEYQQSRRPIALPCLPLVRHRARRDGKWSSGASGPHRRRQAPR